MAIDFASLKKKRNTLDNLVKEVEKITQPQTQENQKDDRFWSLQVDKVGNGSAQIRFLPPTKGEDLPWVRIWNHGFQGPTGKWYIENSLTTLNKPDPVSELNTALWNTGTEANKEVVRKQKRRLTYISNIYVIRDPANPANEGKVMLFKYGKKIFDKIKDVMQPEFEDEQKIDPFNLWEGATFNIRARMVDGYRSYDKSTFSDPAPLSDDDDDLEKIWAKQYSLNEFLDPKNFKSYDELKARLEAVLVGQKTDQPRAEDVDLEPAVQEASTPPKFVRAQPKQVKDDLDDDDESLSYFAKLANDD